MKIVSYILFLLATLVLFLLTGCSSYSDIYIKQYKQSLLTVKVGNTYIEMLDKIGHKPQRYECNTKSCSAFYMIDYKKKNYKEFVFVAERVVEIN